MNYKVLKRVTKNYDEEFSKEQQTDEIEILVGDVIINITEQQCGMKVKPHVRIYAKDYLYSMDFDTFIKNATN